VARAVRRMNSVMMPPALSTRQGCRCANRGLASQRGRVPSVCHTPRILASTAFGATWGNTEFVRLGRTTRTPASVDYGLRLIGNPTGRRFDSGGVALARTPLRPALAPLQPISPAKLSGISEVSGFQGDLAGAFG
jgi:hypothetical protein